MVSKVMGPTSAKERVRYPRKVFSRRARGSTPVNPRACGRRVWDKWDLRFNVMELPVLNGFMAANIANICF